MVKFGFGDLFDRLGLGDILIRARKLVGLAERSPGLTRPQRLRLALEEMGLVFIKLGQYLSTRRDILPDEYLEEFVRLQDSVPALPLGEVLEIIKGELDEEVLLDVSLEPLAAASVGQVHTARLKDGREVVVKIRRPGVEKQAQTDLEILTELAGQVEKHLPFLAYVHPQDLVAEFSRSLQSELNYHREAFNHTRFYRLYAKNPEIKVPELYRSFSTGSILVMERLMGLKVTDLEALEAAGFQRKELARLASRVAMEQFMHFGFFHADPHPGNLFVQPGPVLAFMDFGLVGQLDRSTREQLFKLAVGVVRHDSLAVTRAVLRLFNVTAEIDRDRLELEIGVFLETYFSGTLKDIKIGQCLRDGLDLLFQHQLKTPPDVLLLVKALVQYEGLGTQLDPDFKITEEARPVLASFFKKRFTVSWWQETLKRRGMELYGILENLPRDLAPMYKSLKTGRIQTDMNIKDLHKLGLTVSQASYRLAMSIVLASLVIGSALVIHAKVPPFWRDLPVLGLVGFLGAGLIGFWLVWDFIRRDRK
jgi:ubiquinone biosynthesis protein